MLNSPEYQDVLPHYKSIASWGDIPYQVPIDGDRHYLQYRKDLLEDPGYRAAFKKQTGRDLGVPKTWPELQEIARFFNGRKLADSNIISGIAEVTVSDACSATSLSNVRHPMQTPDVRVVFILIWKHGATGSIRPDLFGGAEGLC